MTRFEGGNTEAEGIPHMFGFIRLQNYAEFHKNILPDLANAFLQIFSPDVMRSQRSWMTSYVGVGFKLTEEFSAHAFYDLG